MLCLAIFAIAQLDRYEVLLILCSGNELDSFNDTMFRK
jgi:hypothetical protein